MGENMVAPMSPPLPYIEWLYEALNTPYGIELATSDPVKLRAALYSTMREAKAQGIEDFVNLSLTISPVCPNSYLWIKHNGKTSNDK